MLDLFQLTAGDLLGKINSKRTAQKQRVLLLDDISGSLIKQTHLQAIDDVFGRGLAFYTDPITPDKNSNSSIFFRKKGFNAPLDIADKKMVHQMEREIEWIDTLRVLADMPELKRTIATYDIQQDPKQVARQTRALIYPKDERRNDRKFLEALIESLANHNILVMEFIDTAKKYNKVKIDGFFALANNIVIKRDNQYDTETPALNYRSSYKREIFTLAHELGHYLINSEEVDDAKSVASPSTDDERWCSEFAFHFLMGQNVNQLLTIDTNRLLHDDELVSSLSQSQHISRLSIFTHLLYINKITSAHYNHLDQALKQVQIDREKAQAEREQAQREHNKAQGKSIPIPPPIPLRSPIEKDIYRNAYLEGVIEDHEVVSRFKPPNNDLDKFLDS